MKLDVININGEKTGRQIDLPDSIFGMEPNEHAVYLSVKQHLANRRQGNSATKERNAIVGSTRKIKRQKGTGTARAGSIKNPLFRGGGRTFGPRTRDYSFKVNRKVRRIAKFSVLSHKAADGSLQVIEDFTFDRPKTNEYKNVLKALGLDGKKTLMMLGDYDQNIYLSSRNVDRAQVAHAKDVHTYQLINAHAVLMMESSIETLRKMYA